MIDDDTGYPHFICRWNEPDLKGIQLFMKCGWLVFWASRKNRFQSLLASHSSTAEPN